MAVGCGVCGAMYVVQCVWGGVHWPSANVCERENVFCECEESMRRCGVLLDDAV